MFSFFNRAPFIRLLISFLCGIITAVHCPIRIFWVLLFFPLTGLLNIYFSFSDFSVQQYGRRWLYGAALNIFLFASGYVLLKLNDHQEDVHHFGNIFGTSKLLSGYLCEPPEVKGKKIRAVVRIEAVNGGVGWVDATGLLLAYFNEDSLSRSLRYGDAVIINSRIQEIPPPRKNGSFDYRKYLSRRGIYHRAFLQSNSWKLLNTRQGNFLLRFAYDAREKLVRILKQSGLNSGEAALMSALVLGVRSELDPELVQAFSATGTIHVLAVSGLHVAIIFALLNSLLFFADRFRYGKLIKTVLVLCSLWYYAIITGLSPSVLRAAVMFSFMVTGDLFSKDSNSVNSLAASAFFLLMINPFYILDVGFQLSYLAVAGIIFCYEKLYRLLETSYWLADKCWALIAMSVSAQLAVFPLGLFYFHQFPNYFIPANLVVVPLTTLMTYAGILFFIVSPIKFLADWIIAALSVLIKFLEIVVGFFESLPFAVCTGINITWWETTLIYVLILFAVLYLTNKKPYQLVVSLMIIILLLTAQLIEKWDF